MNKQKINIDKVINKTININAPLSKVWEVLTTPAIIKLWIAQTELNVITDWRVGSPIVIRGDLHGIKYESKGTILEFQREKTLKYNTWSKISRLPDEPENYSITEFKLSSENNQTILTVIQSNFPGEASYEHYNFYWNSTIHIIKKLAEK